MMKGLQTLLVTVWQLGAAALSRWMPSLAGGRTPRARRTPEELVALIERFGRNPSDPALDWGQWQSFINTPLSDRSLEPVRLECGDLMYAEDELFSRKLLKIAEDIKAGLSVGQAGGS